VFFLKIFIFRLVIRTKCSGRGFRHPRGLVHVIPQHNVRDWDLLANRFIAGFSFLHEHTTSPYIHTKKAKIEPSYTTPLDSLAATYTQNYFGIYRRVANFSCIYICTVVSEEFPQGAKRSQWSGMTREISNN